MQITLDAAPCFKDLLNESIRFLGFKGGRGGGKSETVAEFIVLEMMRRPNLRVLCTREIQKTINESVKSTIERKIREKGVSEYFVIVESEVRCKITDASCMFSGLASHTADSIKSFDAIDLCWIEEAQAISKHSLQILIPTIRKDGSRIIFTWNPRNEFDAVELFFKFPRYDAKVNKVNFLDNKYCPKVTLEEAEHCRLNTPQDYEHIWLGGFQQVTEGAYYTKQIIEAMEAGRITSVPIEKGAPVHVVQDLGGASLKSDHTAMWFFQKLSHEYHLIAYWEGNGTDATEDAALIKSHIQEIGGVLGTIFLPHDGNQHHKETKFSTIELYRSLGFTVDQVPSIGKMDGIDAARRVFHKCWFDSELCKEGLKALRAYHEKKDPITGKSAGAEHDWSSHGADAFRYFAVIASGAGEREAVASLLGGDLKTRSGGSMAEWILSGEANQKSWTDAY